MNNPANQKEIYEDDPEHPIPFLDRLDVFAEFENGGGRLIIVAAQPLTGDDRTLKRILQKIENYLVFVNSDQFPIENGPQTIENTEIAVSLKPGTDQVVFEFLESCVGWVAQNNARLVVE